MSGARPRERKRNWLSTSPGQDRKQKLQENKITHVLAIHDHAEPEYTVREPLKLEGVASGGVASPSPSGPVHVQVYSGL